MNKSHKQIQYRNSDKNVTEYIFTGLLKTEEIKYNSVTQFSIEHVLRHKININENIKSMPLWTEEFKVQNNNEN